MRGLSNAMQAIAGMLTHAQCLWRFHDSVPPTKYEVSVRPESQRDHTGWPDSLGGHTVVNFFGLACVDELDVGHAQPHVVDLSAVNDHGIGAGQGRASEAAAQLSAIAQQEMVAAHIMMHINLQSQGNVNALLQHVNSAIAGFFDASAGRFMECWRTMTRLASQHLALLKRFCLMHAHRHLQQMAGKAVGCH